MTQQPTDLHDRVLFRRGVLLAAATLALSLGVAMVVVTSRPGSEEVSFSEKLQTVHGLQLLVGRAANERRSRVMQEIAVGNPFSSRPSSALEVTAPTIIISDGQGPPSFDAMGPAAFEAALSKRFEDTRAIQETVPRQLPKSDSQQQASPQLQAAEAGAKAKAARQAVDAEKKLLADVKANLAAEEKVEKELEEKEARDLKKVALEKEIAALQAKVSQLENTQNTRTPATKALPHPPPARTGEETTKASIHAALNKKAPQTAHLAQPQKPPPVALVPGILVANAKEREGQHRHKTINLDMSDIVAGGDADLQVASAIKQVVGSKSAEGANLTSSNSNSTDNDGVAEFATADEKKAIEAVQAAVKAAADAEIDEAVATSKHAAKASYAAARDHFLEKESTNNVTGTLTYSASDEIYHDSNKWVKELKSLRKDGLETLSERPQLAYSVKVPTGVGAGKQFVAQIPDGRRVMVTVPARALSGDLVVIEVPVEVGSAKSLVATIDDIAKQHALANRVTRHIAKQHAQADIPKQRFIHQDSITEALEKDKHLISKFIKSGAPYRRLITESKANLPLTNLPRHAVTPAINSPRHNLLPRHNLPPHTAHKPLAKTHVLHAEVAHAAPHGSASAERAGAAEDVVPMKQLKNATSRATATAQTRQQQQQQQTRPLAPVVSQARHASEETHASEQEGANAAAQLRSKVVQSSASKRAAGAAAATDATDVLQPTSAADAAGETLREGISGAPEQNAEQEKTADEKAEEELVDSEKAMAAAKFAAEVKALEDPTPAAAAAAGEASDAAAAAAAAQFRAEVKTLADTDSSNEPGAGVASDVDDEEAGGSGGRERERGGSGTSGRATQAASSTNLPWPYNRTLPRGSEMGPPLKQGQDRGHVAAPKVLSSDTAEAAPKVLSSDTAEEVPSSKASHLSSQTPSLANSSVGNAAETKATPKEVRETRTRETRTKKVRRLRGVAQSDVTQWESETRTKELSATPLLVVAQSANEHEANTEAKAGEGGVKSIEVGGVKSSQLGGVKSSDKHVSPRQSKLPPTYIKFRAAEANEGESEARQRAGTLQRDQKPRASTSQPVQKKQTLRSSPPRRVVDWNSVDFKGTTVSALHSSLPDGSRKSGAVGVAAEEAVEKAGEEQPEAKTQPAEDKVAAKVEATEEKVVAERHYAEVAEQVESVASPAAQKTLAAAVGRKVPQQPRVAVATSATSEAHGTSHAMSKLESQLGQAIGLANVVRTEDSRKMGRERERLAQLTLPTATPRGGGRGGSSVLPAMVYRTVLQSSEQGEGTEHPEAQVVRGDEVEKMDASRDVAAP